MGKLNDVIKSFQPKSELNPKIWTEPGDKMNPKVRENLLEIADQFISTFGMDVIISDIIVVGSIANYNWSKFSDIDLHILVDYNQFSNKLKQLYVDFFDLKKIVFNQKRDIKFFGYDVECYVEDADMKGVSGGVYSILEDEWLSKPKKESIGQPDYETIKQKSKQWMRTIDGVLDNIENESPEEIKDIIKKYKDKLKKYRLCGLEKGGEMSNENLVFKVLRRNGYIEKLYNYPTQLIDKKLSLEQKIRIK
jgi:predicted nucleotidyltransferase